MYHEWPNSSFLVFDKNNFFYFHKMFFSSIECSKILSSDSRHFRNVAMLQCYIDFWSISIKKSQFWIFETTKSLVFQELENCYFHKNEKNEIFMFIRFIVKRIFDIFRTFVSFVITWLVTWSCWWRHNKVIKRFWIVSRDVLSVLKWGASVLNRA